MKCAIFVTQILASEKPPKKYTFNDATISISLTNLYSNMKKFTGLFQIITTIFSNSLCFIHCFCMEFDDVFTCLGPNTRPVSKTKNKA